ncbi:MAG: hypothetical protein NW223_04670 [Hyphomicrobiaceae bacterium]|nr:hypothetical protein [Hyphomicrobiaceae bacterium]
MSAEMLAEIAGRLDEARERGGPVVIRGRPGMASAGFDLNTFSRGETAARAMGTMLDPAAGRLNGPVAAAVRAAAQDYRPSVAATA